jgi:predicted transcriptional regulator
MRTVGDEMLGPVVVTPGDTLQDAAAAMLAADAQAAMVIEDGRVRGLLTAAGIAAALARGLDPSLTDVVGVADREAPTVRAGDPLVEAHRVMRVSEHRVAAVVGSRGEPVGMLVDSEA